MLIQKNKYNKTIFKKMSDFHNHSGDRVGAIISLALGFIAIINLEQIGSFFRFIAPIVGVAAGIYSIYKNSKK
jgi:hypothetical protein